MNISTHFRPLSTLLVALIKYGTIVKERWKNSPDIPHFFYWLCLRVRKLLKIGFGGTCRGNPETIDVVIPTVSKDAEALVILIESLKNICESVNKIFIVSPRGDFIEDFCRRQDCVFVDERTVLGYGKEKINYQVDGLDRSGWMFQQLIKLSGDVFVEKDNYFVLDSDTILLRPHSFFNQGRVVLFENEEWHAPYFKAFEYLFGYPTRNRLSFTSHMMLFNTLFLKQMKQEIEARHGKPWDKTYISTISLNPGEESCVSDYDTYANWLYIKQRKKILRRPLYNRTVPKTELSSLPRLIKKFAKSYNSISFHSYYQKKRSDIINETNV